MRRIDLIKKIKRILNEERQKLILKEGTSQQEIEELAINLIDYLGGNLPSQGWSRNNRIMDYFRDLGFKDNDPMVHKIYNAALRLNR